MARVMLDTNVYIEGYGDLTSPAAQIFRFLNTHPDFRIVISHEILEEIRRVARRLKGKDWAGIILDHLWRNPSLEVVILPAQRQEHWEQYKPLVPSEDLDIVLTAILGRVDILVSNNRELLRSVENLAFRCLTPTEFLEQYGAD